MRRRMRTSVPVITVALIVGGIHAPAVAQPDSGSPVAARSAPVPAGFPDAASDALTSLLSQADQARAGTKPALALRSSAALDATASASTSSAQEERGIFAEAGLAISASETRVENARVTGRSKGRTLESAGLADARVASNADVLVTEAVITTTVRSTTTAGEVVESSWSDTHRLTMAATVDGSYIVLSDEVVPPPDDSTDTTDIPRPSPEDVSSDAPALATASATALAASSIQPSANGTKMKDYALLWTKSANASKMNPAYPDLSNDCANFVSQALRAGGWVLKNGVNPRDTGNWHYNLTGPSGASRTWSNAATLYYYTSAKAGWGKLSSIYNASIGDILFVDWDPNGVADGEIDHAMVVTGVSYPGTPPYTVPLISQKSSNRHNIPITQSIKLAKDQGKTKLVWYGLDRR